MNRSWFSLLKMVVLAFGLTACEYIHEDLEPCPMGLDLTFRYDYNLQRADMFSDHVGGVTVYLFDENGNYLMQGTLSVSCVGTSERLRRGNGCRRSQVPPPGTRCRREDGRPNNNTRPRSSWEYAYRSSWQSAVGYPLARDADNTGRSRFRQDYPRYGFAGAQHQADSCGFARDRRAPVD